MVFGIRFVVLFLSLLVCPSLIFADQIIGKEEWVEKGCEWSKSDIKDGALDAHIRAWFNKDDKLKSKVTLKPPELYYQYLLQRYEIRIGVNDRLKPALIAAFEDLPDLMRSKLHQLTFKPIDPSVCKEEPGHLFAVDEGTTPIQTLSICEDNLANVSFQNLKQAFAHLIARVLASKTGFPDTKAPWTSISGWKKTAHRCEGKSPYCEVYSFEGQQELLEKFDKGLISVLPRFASPYAATANFEDFAESFARFRYDRDFYNRAKSDHVLAQKLAYMENLFGEDYRTSTSSGCKSLKQEQNAINLAPETITR
jgi:hypothetical protein